MKILIAFLAIAGAVLGQSLGGSIQQPSTGGTNATTINGAAVPASAVCPATNSSSQITANATCTYVNIANAPFAADTTGATAINTALTSALATGKAVYFPTGTYQINNSSSPFSSSYSGQLIGDGQYGTKLFCTTMTVNCISFSGSSGLTIEGLSFAYQGSLPARNNSRLLVITNSSNINLSNLVFTNGPSAGLDLETSANVKMHDIAGSGFEGNTFFFVDNTGLQANELSSVGSGDAALEISHYDSSTGVSSVCQDTVLTNFHSSGDFAGINVDACKNVSISSFDIHDTLGGGITVQADVTTTATGYSDQVNIGQGIITNPGGGNPSNSAVRALLLPTPINSSTSAMNVSLHDIVIKGGNTGANAVQVNASNYWNVRFDNVKSYNSGGECFDIGGQTIVSNGLECNAAQSFGLVIRSAGSFIANGTKIYNALLGGGDTRAILNTSTGTVSMNGVTSISDQSTARVTVDDEGATGSHTFTNVVYSITDGSTPTVSNGSGNTAFASSWNVNGGAFQVKGSLNLLSGMTSLLTSVTGAAGQTVPSGSCCVTTIFNTSTNKGQIASAKPGTANYELDLAGLQFGMTMDGLNTFWTDANGHTQIGRNVINSGTVTPVVEFKDGTATTGATRVQVTLGAADTSATTTFTNQGASSSAGVIDTGLTSAPCLSTSSAGLLQTGPCFSTAAVTLTPGTGVTSVTCTSATCDVNGGSLAIVGGTATTGTFATVSYTALATAPRTCSVSMNGGSTFLGLGHGTPSTTSFTLTSAVSVLGVTFTMDYQCKP